VKTAMHFTEKEHLNNTYVPSIKIALKLKEQA